MTLMEKLKDYFVSLTATNTVRSNFGAAFAFNTNIFLGVTPATPTSCVTIIPYAGRPPNPRVKDAYYSSIQVVVRHSTYKAGWKTTQAIINSLHLNQNIVTASIPSKFYALQSQPIVMPRDEEEYPMFVANFDILHTKYTVS